MSYLDYTVTLYIDPNDYIHGRDRHMTAIAKVKSGVNTLATFKVPVPPVTGEDTLKTAISDVFRVAISKNWRRDPVSAYSPGEFVRVIADSAAHGFPVGSIIQLKAIDDDPDFDDAPDITWEAVGYSTGMGNIESRWIGENDFTKVGGRHENC